MRPSGVFRAAPALLAGGVAVALLFTSTVRVPGHRGASRIASGFVPGRWDARFVVARGPAALTFPDEPLRARLRVSGPATLVVSTGGSEAVTAVLTAEPAPVVVDLPRGGRADLAADATIRLHDVTVTRLGPLSWARVAVVVAAALAAALIAARSRGVGALLGSMLFVSVVAAAASHGRLAGLALAVGARRALPAAAVLGLIALFPLPTLLLRGRGARAERPRAPVVPMVFAALALASCLAQVLLLPQPLLIGDPAAYHDIGRRFAAALQEVHGLGDVGDALQILRPYGGLAATGLLYGALIRARDALTTIYAAHALAMALAVGFLVRAAHRIGGPRLAVLTGLIALLYPTFPVICGIVQPEPLILLLWTYALDRLLRARDEASPRGFAAAGLAFGLGLALHPQGLWFLLAALVLLVLPFARALSRPPARGLAAAFALGLLPVAVATAAGEAWSRPAAYVLEERHGFWAYTARVPLGFWLFLDTDGWQGPLRIDETRYARGLLSAEAEGAGGGRPGRLAYTARFLAANPVASVRAVLRNLHRLFHVPDNPFRRGFLLPYAAQVAWHRALVVLFLLAVPVVLARGAAPLLLPVAILAATYPLYHVFNKYAVPGTPFLLLGAALAVERILFAEPRAAQIALLLALAALGAALAPGEMVLRGVPTVVAEAVPPVLLYGGLAGAFLFAARRWAPDAKARAATAAVAALALASSLAAAWRDPGPRDLAVSLNRPVRHEVTLDPESLARLQRAPEAWLFLDLDLPDGRGDTLRLVFDGGLVVTGPDLRPTMPTFGLATLRGGRDPRTFRQWWAVRFDPRMVRDARVALMGEDPTGRARMHGDLAAPRSPGTCGGLSLGQWPYLSVYRLMHDGEYRLRTTQTLEGSRTSAVDGRMLPGALGIRLVVLDEAGGAPPWVAGPTAGNWRPLAVY